MPIEHTSRIDLTLGFSSWKPLRKSSLKELHIVVRLRDNHSNIKLYNKMKKNYKLKSPSILGLQK